MSESQIQSRPVGERIALYANEPRLRTAAKQMLFKASRALKVPVRELVEPMPLAPADLDRLQAMFARPKFFVIGYPRSGTTLLARLLALHPEVHCNWQARFFSQVDSLSSILLSPGLIDWATRGNNHWSDSPTAGFAIFRAACDFVMEAQAAQLGKSIVGDKSPDVAWSSNLNALWAIYPDANLINIVRDGRDVALSRRIQQLVDRPGNLDRRGRALLAAVRAGGSIPDQLSLFTGSWLAREAARWEREVVETDRKARQLFGTQYHALTFERLLESPIQELRLLWDRLGAGSGNVKPEVIDAELANNPAADWHEQVEPALSRQMPRGRAGGWKTIYRNKEQSVFAQHASFGLKAWGYELES